MSFFHFVCFDCRKSVIRDHSTEDDVHLVHRELDVGKQTKSVQVERYPLIQSKSNITPNTNKRHLFSLKKIMKFANFFFDLLFLVFF